MGAKPKRILFISHEASVSGATHVLLYLMEWIIANTGAEVSVLLKEDGPAREKFEKICRVYLYEPAQPTFKNKFIAFLYRKFIWKSRLSNNRRRLLAELSRGKFDLIYANTVGVGGILDFLRPLQCKAVTHVHELQFVIEYVGAEIIKQVVNNTQLYICACDEVKDNLVENLKIDGSQIVILPELVDFAKIDAGYKTSNIRERLGIAPGSFVIGASGSVEWRKGADLFVEVAIQVITKVPSAHFVWVATPRASEMMPRLQFDIKKAGLEERVHFLGHFEDPYPYFRTFDLFLLTSREDPYPLVCIENLYLNKPVICFEGSGGAVSLVARYQAGRAVPYLNTALMAQGVMEYIQGAWPPPTIDTAKLRSEHSVENVAPEIFRNIQKILK